jgi:hypothetical protein
MRESPCKSSLQGCLRQFHVVPKQPSHGENRSSILLGSAKFPTIQNKTACCEGLAFGQPGLRRRLHDPFGCLDINRAGILARRRHAAHGRAGPQFEAFSIAALPSSILPNCLGRGQQHVRPLADVIAIDLGRAEDAVPCLCLCADPAKAMPLTLPS